MVDEQGLLLGNWVCADNWVDVADWLASDDTATDSSELSLLMSRVDSLEALESLLESIRESVVGLNLGAEKSVTTSNVSLLVWNVESVQEGGSWWLLLVSDIGVPGNGAAAVGEVVVVVFLSAHTGTAVDEMNLWKASWGTRCWVYDQEVRDGPVNEG